jgi:prepilin-type N-terminal cleavage/methylation domain-containing protein
MVQFFYMKRKHKRNLQGGFTLIELLVVIAIIGMLSSVVFTAVGDVRARAADRVIVKNLETVLMQAQFYYEANGNYGTVGYGRDVCSILPTGSSVFLDPTIAAAVRSTLNFGVGTTCFSLNGNFVAVFELKTGGGKNNDSNIDTYCVDHTMLDNGKGKFYTYQAGESIALRSSTVKPANGFAYCR